MAHVDETYLRVLCEHLAVNHPEPGSWTTSARRFYRGLPAGRRLLSGPSLQLYEAADAAGLPVADYSVGDDWEHEIYDDVLAAVLGMYAALERQAPNGGPHQAGGPDVGSVLARIHLASGAMASLDVTLQALTRGRPQGLQRTLLACEQKARGGVGVDLRTVAALAYGPRGLTGGPRLYSNPTGHWPHPLESRNPWWSPVVETMRTAYGW